MPREDTLEIRTAITCTLLALVALHSLAGADAPGSKMMRARAENLAANPSFEGGAGAAPTGWTLEGSGVWATVAYRGKRSIAVTGNGKESSLWRAELELKPGATYLVGFWARGENASGGCIISGPDFANCDYGVEPQWKYHESVFVTPAQGDHYLRFGQWMVNGIVYFDDIALREVTPIHVRRQGLELGAGECVSARRYEATLVGDYEGGNYRRNLEAFNAAWNTNRWRMGEGSSITYRHDLGDVEQRSAAVTVELGFYESGSCLIEATNDGQNFVAVGEVGKESRTLPLPAQLFPARAIQVRLSAVRANRRDGDSAPGSFQITGYRYSAELSRPLPDMVGQTVYLQQTRRASDLTVAVESLGSLRPAPENEARIMLDSKRARDVKVSLVIGPTRTTRNITLKPGRTIAALPYSLSKAGALAILLKVTEGSRNVLYEARAAVSVPLLLGADYGRLISAGPLPVWWCGATYKVSTERPLPRVRGKTVRLAAARNEYEPFQLVVRPQRNLERMTVSATPLVGPRGAQIAAPEIRLVGYVNVVHPTDELGMPGLWPDPLPRYRGPLDVPADRNQPIWLTVYVPDDAAPGLYRGAVTISAGNQSVNTPVQLRVWDFALPKESAIRSGFGFSEEWAARYENLSGEALAATVDKYYRAFHSHRISPYTPMGGPTVKFDAGKATLDWTEFDRKAAYYLDELGFNSFSMPVQGLGGGTFYESAGAEIAGTKAGTPEYKQLMAQYLGGIQQHLEEKGWLHKAYIYWFDEPGAEQFEYVRGGMETLKEFAPKLNRFLTVRPVEQLYGAVNTWCVPVGVYDEKTCHQRQQAGDEIWWYLCCGPHAPFVGLFIDHPAVDFRTWLWMSHKYGVTGILIWHTNWWTSPTAFPEPALQNPYEDPMSYVSGYGVPAGARQFWGNGDGRLWYPSNRHVGDDKTPYTDGPVPSIRVELLREGIEDYEYFQLLKRLAARPGAPAEAKALLEIPKEIIADLTHYNFDPEPMMRHRAKVAEMIERLAGGPAARSSGGAR